MPKLKETPAQRMERVFRAAVMYGLERRGRECGGPGEGSSAEPGYRVPAGQAAWILYPAGDALLRAQVFQ